MGPHALSLFARQLIELEWALPMYDGYSIRGPSARTGDPDLDLPTKSSTSLHRIFIFHYHLTPTQTTTKKKLEGLLNTPIILLNHEILQIPRQAGRVNTLAHTPSPCSVPL